MLPNVSWRQQIHEGRNMGEITRGDSFDWDNYDYQAERDVDELSRTDRMNICKSCDQLGAFNFCAVCSCFMPIKVWISTATCPEEKW